MASPQEFAAIVTVQGSRGAGVPCAWRSLASRLAATILPLAPLLLGSIAIEPLLTASRRAPPGFTSFWYCYGALALCYAFGLHWTEHRRILWAAGAAMLAAAIMAFVTVALTFAGIATGIAAALIFVTLMTPDAGIAALFILVPGLAGMAWGVAVAHLARRFVTGGDVPTDWLRLHVLWGAVAGPPMLFSTVPPVSPYVPALVTTVATLSLTVVSWWRLRRSRRCLRT
jgi:hypothetical protein